jgi:hypothetical protein
MAPREKLATDLFLIAPHQARPAPLSDCHSRRGSRASASRGKGTQAFDTKKGRRHLGPLPSRSLSFALAGDDNRATLSPI